MQTPEQWRTTAAEYEAQARRRTDPRERTKLGRLAAHCRDMADRLEEMTARQTGTR